MPSQPTDVFSTFCSPFFLSLPLMNRADIFGGADWQAKVEALKPSNEHATLLPQIQAFGKQIVNHEADLFQRNPARHDFVPQVFALSNGARGFSEGIGSTMLQEMSPKEAETLTNWLCPRMLFDILLHLERTSHAANDPHGPAKCYRSEAIRVASEVMCYPRRPLQASAETSLRPLKLNLRNVLEEALKVLEMVPRTEESRRMEEGPLPCQDYGKQLLSLLQDSRTFSKARHANNICHAFTYVAMWMLFCLSGVVPTSENIKREVKRLCSEHAEIAIEDKQLPAPNYFTSKAHLFLFSPFASLLDQSWTKPMSREDHLELFRSMPPNMTEDMFNCRSHLFRIPLNIAQGRGVTSSITSGIRQCLEVLKAPRFDPSSPIYDPRGFLDWHGCASIAEVSNDDVNPGGSAYQEQVKGSYERSSSPRAKQVQSANLSESHSDDDESQSGDSHSAVEQLLGTKRKRDSMESENQSNEGDQMIRQEEEESDHETNEKRVGSGDDKNTDDNKGLNPSLPCPDGMDVDLVQVKNVSRSKAPPGKKGHRAQAGSSLTKAKVNSQDRTPTASPPKKQLRLDSGDTVGSTSRKVLRNQLVSSTRGKSGEPQPATGSIQDQIEEHTPILPSLISQLRDLWWRPPVQAGKRRLPRERVRALPGSENNPILIDLTGSDDESDNTEKDLPRLGGGTQPHNKFIPVEMKPFDSKGQRHTFVFNAVCKQDSELFEALHLCCEKSHQDTDRPCWESNPDASFLRVFDWSTFQNLSKEDLCKHMKNGSIVVRGGRALVHDIFGGEGFDLDLLAQVGPVNQLRCMQDLVARDCTDSKKHLRKGTLAELASIIKDESNSAVINALDVSAGQGVQETPPFFRKYAHDILAYQTTAGVGSFSSIDSTRNAQRASAGTAHVASAVSQEEDGFWTWTVVGGEVGKYWMMWQSGEIDGGLAYSWKSHNTLNNPAEDKGRWIGILLRPGDLLLQDPNRPYASISMGATICKGGRFLNWWTILKTVHGILHSKFHPKNGDVQEEIGIKAIQRMIAALYSWIHDLVDCFNGAMELSSFRIDDWDTVHAIISTVNLHEVQLVLSDKLSEVRTRPQGHTFTATEKEYLATYRKGWSLRKTIAFKLSIHCDGEPWSDYTWGLVFVESLVHMFAAITAYPESKPELFQNSARWDGLRSRAEEALGYYQPSGGRSLVDIYHEKIERMLKNPQDIHYTRWTRQSFEVFRKAEDTITPDDVLFSASPELAERFQSKFNSSK